MSELQNANECCSLENPHEESYLLADGERHWLLAHSSVVRMPTELQDALEPEYVSMMENWAVSQSEYRKIHAVIKAARRVANLDRDAAYGINVWTLANQEMVDRIIDAALGITEEDEAEGLEALQRASAELWNDPEDTDEVTEDMR